MLTGFLKFIRVYQPLSLLFLIFSGSPYAQSTNNETSAGEFLITNDAHQHSSALLLDTKIVGQIDGMIANLSITQRFKNTPTAWVNGKYVFPLPEGAAIDQLQLIIGERVIKGVIKERGAAKRAFDRAKTQGKQAGLLEQQRPNLFTVSVANIAPNSEIVAHLHLIEQARFDQNKFSLRLPTTLTPRYIPGQKIELNLTEQSKINIDSTSGWASNTDQVTDASQITPNQAYPAQLAKQPNFSVELKLNSGIELESVSSPSHVVNATENTNNVYSIRLTNQTAPMDKDFVLYWKPVTSSMPSAAVFNQRLGDEFYNLTFFMPPTVNITNALPREVIFIIDSSGSMAGESMRQAKSSLLKALDLLSPQDKFNIIDFNSDFRVLFPNALKVSTSTLTQAKGMITGLYADGGTEMYAALDYALRAAASAQHLRQIIFITDGSIGNEQQILKLIHEHLNDSRLFTIGIGSAPNSYFMREAATFGRGSYTYISDLSQVNETLSGLFTKLNRPILKDIKVDWPNPQTMEVFPHKVPDLYAGEPLILLSKSSAPVQSIIVSGELLQSPWTRQIASGYNDQNNAKNLDALWARLKISSLMNQTTIDPSQTELIKPKIIELAIKHHLMTRYTSFVAIDQNPIRPANAQAQGHQVNNLMPAGSTMMLPQTATASELLLITGLLLMLFGGYMYVRSAPMIIKK